LQDGRSHSSPCAKPDLRSRSRRYSRMFPVHVCLSAHCDIRSLANSVSPFVATSARFRAEGSESRESQQPIHLLIRVDGACMDRYCWALSLPRSIGYAHGSKDSARLDHIRFYGSRSAQCVVQVYRSIVYIVFQRATLIRCSVGFGKMRRFISHYFSRKKTRDVSNVSAHSCTPDGIYIIDCLSRQALSSRYR